MGKNKAEGGGGIGQIRAMAEVHDPNQQPATVHFLDSTKNIFYVPKKADGGELFIKVVTFLGLNEKDYFALSFSDSDGNRHWLYEDKRISKQLKGHPWDFNFEVKFYPPDPATLNDDITRHYLSLQVQRDISTGKLPATVATHALLGSYVAQSVHGDYEPSVQYIDFLRNCRLAPEPNETLYEKVEELHKQHKGETSNEAELHYLDNAKKLSMYGVHLFPAKDGKNVPVQIGVNAHGINVYRDQIRVHRFLWQNISKIAYRRNIFVIKVKPGELEKNETTAAFKMPDHDAAERVWKCAVEHHTFFRLIQPEEKPHKGLFRWGSAKFRYQGRTQFQSKLASQMPTNQPVQRSQSAHLVRNDENTPLSVSKNQTLPMNYSEDGTSKESGWNSSQMSSPEKSYTMRIQEISQRQENNTVNGTEVGDKSRTANLSGSSGILHGGGTHPSTTVTPIITTTTNSTTAAIDRSFDQRTPERFPSLHISPHSTQIAKESMSSIGQPSADGQNRQPLSASMTSDGSDITDLKKEKNLQYLPVQDTAVVYHPGHYEQEAAGNRSGPLRDPPVEPGDDFVFIHRPKLGAAGKIFHESGSETDILVKEEDIETYPIRYFVNVYHSGFSRFTCGNKNIDSFEYEKCLGTDDTVEKQKLNKRDYPKDEKFIGQILRTERFIEMPSEPLKKHVQVYNQGFYGDVERNETDVDDKGNLRYSVRGYTNSIKSQEKPLRERNTEVKNRAKSYKVEKSGKEVMNGNHAVNGPGSLQIGEDKTKKVAHLYLKQAPEVKQAVQGSGTQREILEEKTKRITNVQETEFMNDSSKKTAGIPGSDDRVKAYGDTQPKQIYHHSTHAQFEGGKDTDENRVKNVGSDSVSSLHTTVYHPHISDLKDEIHEKESGQRGDQKATTGNADAKQKKIAILHLSESNKNDANKRPVGEEIITKHIIREAEEIEYPYHSDVTELEKHNVSKKSTDLEASENKNSSQKRKALLHLCEDQKQNSVPGDKVLPEADSRKIEPSKEITHMAVPTYSVSAVKKPMEKVKPIVPPKKPLIEYANFNTPLLQKLSRTDEIKFQPLVLVVKDTRRNDRLSNRIGFRRATHGGTVEFVAKENVDPGSYKLNCCTYKGPLENTMLSKELQFSPVQKHSAIYHPGNSYEKSRKTQKQKGDLKLNDSEKLDVAGIKKTAVLHLKNDGFGRDGKEKVGGGIYYAKMNRGDPESQNTPHHLLEQQSSYKMKIIPKVPERKSKMEPSEVKKRSFRYHTHPGDTEIVEKLHVKPESYKLIAVPYDGLVSRLKRESELPFTPLQEYARVYHTRNTRRKIRNSSSESSSSSSSSESSSDSSTSSASSSYVTEEKSELKKAILHLKPDENHSTTVRSSDLGRDEGFLSFWRRLDRREKEDSTSHVNERNYETSPKQYTGQQESDSFKNKESSTHFQGVSVSPSDPVMKQKNDSWETSEKSKIDAKLYFKDETSAACGSKDSDKQGKFDPFAFWRSTEKAKETFEKKPDTMLIRSGNFDEKPRSYTGDRSLSVKGPNVNSAENEEKPIVNETVRSTASVIGNLSKKEPIKDDAGMYVSERELNAETKISTLKRLIEASDDGSPSTGYFCDNNQEISPTTAASADCASISYTSPAAEVPYQPLRAKISIQHDQLGHAKELRFGASDNVHVKEGSVSPTADLNIHKDVGYSAKIAVKSRYESSIADAEKDAKLKKQGTSPYDKSDGLVSSFSLRGVSLRESPDDLKGTLTQGKVETHNSNKGNSVKDIHNTASIPSQDTVDETATDKKIAMLRVREEEHAGSDSGSDKNKKGEGGFFSSLWHVSKPKDSNDQEKVRGEIHEKKGEVGAVQMISPSNELLAETPRVQVSGTDKNRELSSGIPRDEKYTKEDFVPVCDFSYVPNFGTFDSDDVKISEPDGFGGEEIGTVKKTALITVKDKYAVDGGLRGQEVSAETKRSRGSVLTRLLGSESKDVEEYYDAPAPPESYVAGSEDGKPTNDMSSKLKEEKFVSELSWEKRDTPYTGKHYDSEPKTSGSEEGPLIYRDATSGGELSDEPYKFTQTPPDFAVSEVYTKDAKGPLTLIEQIRRQVTQVVAKASPSSEKKKKSKKEKKRSKKGALRRGNDISSSETESGSNYDSSAFSQQKEGESQAEVIDTLPYDEAALDENRTIFEKRDSAYQQKGTGTLQANDQIGAAGSHPYKTMESWQEEATAGPETTVTDVDYQGNVIKRTIKTQQIKHTVQRRTYQTSAGPGQNGDSVLRVVESTQKSITPQNITHAQVPAVETHNQAHEPKTSDIANGNDYWDIPGELISCRTITQGNRTIETITYKTEKNGIIETHVEHRVTIQSGDNIDHDAELSQAILEATNMNPDMTVEKIEVKQESQC